MNGMPKAECAAMLHSPWGVEAQVMLNLHEDGADADETAGGGEHDEHPDIELDGGPVVSVDAGDVPLADVRGRPRGEGGGGGHGDGIGLDGDRRI